MEFDRTTTAVAFVVLLAVLLGGTLTSGMPPAIAYPVSGGLVAFSALFLKPRPRPRCPLSERCRRL